VNGVYDNPENISLKKRHTLLVTNNKVGHAKYEAEGRGLLCLFDAPNYPLLFLPTHVIWINTRSYDQESIIFDILISLEQFHQVRPSFNLPSLPLLDLTAHRLTLHFVGVVLQWEYKGSSLLGLDATAKFGSTRKEAECTSATLYSSLLERKGSSACHAAHVRHSIETNIGSFKTKSAASKADLAAFLVILVRDHSDAKGILTNGKATFFNTAKAIMLTCNSELAVAAVTSSPAANVGVRYTGIRHFDCLVSEFVDIKI